MNYLGARNWDVPTHRVFFGVRDSQDLVDPPQSVSFVHANWQAAPPKFQTDLFPQTELRTGWRDDAFFRLRPQLQVGQSLDARTDSRRAERMPLEDLTRAVQPGVRSSHELLKQANRQMSPRKRRLKQLSVNFRLEKSSLEDSKAAHCAAKSEQIRHSTPTPLLSRARARVSTSISYALKPAWRS